MRPQWSPFAWFPEFENSDLLEFTPSMDPGTSLWVPWSKPRGCSWVHIAMVGSGGQGGAGMTGATSTVRAGGGGGGAGARANFSVPADKCPDELWIYVPRGGFGAVNAAGNAGAQVLISTRPNQIGNVDLFARSGDQNAGGGGKGTTAAGAAGAGGVFNSPRANMPGYGGTVDSQTGIAGQVGFVGLGAARQYNVNSGQLLGEGGLGGAGASAANAEFDAGALTGSGIVPTLPGGKNGGGRGQDGYVIRQGGLFLSVPPTGGGSAQASTGGDGGSARAAPGCGGGGGGGGINGGQGGEGGPGYCGIAVS